MAVPRRKMSKSRIGMRRSGQKMQTITWIEDKKSGELRRPHHIDLKTACIAAARFWPSRPTFNHCLLELWDRSV